MSVMNIAATMNKGSRYLSNSETARKTKHFARKNPMITLGLIGALLGLALILLTAMTANIQQANNELELQNQYLEAEIDSIANEITDETTLDKIESSAANKYGMVYPNSSNYISIKDEADPSGNLADAIKDEVYR